MFLKKRLLSALVEKAGLLLAGVTFVIGLGLGPTGGPVTASRGSTEPPSPPAATTAEPSAPRLAYPAEVLRVLDGDTFEARVQLWPGLAITTRVRLRGIDTPE